MHELGITKNVLEIAIGEAANHSAGQIKVVRLTIGELTNVDPESVRFYFEVLSRGTVAEGAALEILPVKAVARCGKCAAAWSPTEGDFYCPACGLSGAEVVEGQELRVDSLEVE